ncbi:hypothetical protein CDL15_Pgr004431 [Punica granatum]|uniref:Retrotransposon Copia-like N-terminal domain-containing protein n=1 Tax=Punica granatum TaxID=22663 RepID=A0A218XGW8_PUNGR|nr:hypothetical protein CDL15_Pgr004431 [Punica granatum]
MISLVKLCSKWQKIVELGRSRRISYLAAEDQPNNDSPTHKGHFVIYTIDESRFTLPLKYLGSKIFQQLLKISEDEFGLPGDGPIRMPCGAVFMQYSIIASENRSIFVWLKMTKEGEDGVTGTKSEVPSVYKLSSSDSPGNTLISCHLNGLNYLTWARAMTTTLKAKDKLAFIEGKELN